MHACNSIQKHFASFYIIILLAEISDHDFDYWGEIEFLVCYCSFQAAYESRELTNYLPTDTLYDILYFSLYN